MSNDDIFILMMTTSYLYRGVIFVQPNANNFCDNHFSFLLIG